MSSYLTTLAARALDQPQPIRPRLPSLFEPATGPRVNFREVSVNQPIRRAVHKSSSADELAHATPESRTRVSKLRPANETRGAERTSEEVDDRSHAIKSLSQSVEASVPPTNRVDESIAQSIERRLIEIRTERESEGGAKASAAPEPIKPTVQVAQTITIEQTNFVDRSADPSPQPKAAATRSEESQAVSPQAIVVKPEVAANAAEPVFVEPQLLAPDSPPSVKITIGRIDVRAVMPPAPSTVAVARPPAIKALSLDEYLQQRNGDHG